MSEDTLLSIMVSLSVLSRQQAAFNYFQIRTLHFLSLYHRFLKIETSIY
ncbi:hypothetical protein Xhom_03761 [Xenorhabdus hominickii]|uniref:Uncharacterized protein n=1 Tax=Xenorhabdus hominickii TaxID=351679 RepID=A0A2G0Q182_XENHO|nr:hypothetical protein Xhom_04655 [Xenorhabdus hominickii]PHM52966.1 hypothetical protein Xhom_03848 [Xenorhabdus hominickii]PHM53760.1 hypothetical protein Xhom_03761 [Xenorhabdus hominickii]